jgi:hypothetical protein
MKLKSACSEYAHPEGWILYIMRVLVVAPGGMLSDIVWYTQIR